MKKPAVPNCSRDAFATAHGSSAVTANIADPKLVEIAQIEAQSDCYKDAEVTARRRLVRLQAAVKGGR